MLPHHDHEDPPHSAPPPSEQAYWFSPEEVDPRLAARGDAHPDKRRRVLGAVLYGVFAMAGLLLNVAFFVTGVFGGARPPEELLSALVAGAIPAFAMLALYLPVPSVLDRFDPEPFRYMAMAFAWGALVATGLSGLVTGIVRMTVESAYGSHTGSLVATLVSAPVVEEVAKGLFVAGFFHFMRREFDGVVDGIVYAFFVALGFAAVENAAYYARAVLDGQAVFERTFMLRGIVAPWGHPLYTAMTGIGIGLARESPNPRVRHAAPWLGLLGAVLLHVAWNVVPSFGAAAFSLSIVLWFAFVGAFTTIVVALVRRKGAIIRRYLRDEVLVGTITAEQLDFVTSPFGRLRSYRMHDGEDRRRFLRAAARLALSKWHTARALKASRRTISIEFIGPLRMEVRRLGERLSPPSD